MKKMMAGYAVFLVLVFSGCDNAPDYAPGTPEGLRAELRPPTYDAASIYLHYDPQSYYPAGTRFEVVHGTSPSPATILSPLVTLSQDRLIIPRAPFFSSSGTYYFKVRAKGAVETGADSSEVSVTIP
ncbi:MAG: hypothetical protein LBK77_02375 [Spirochaetaceae bacterium]|jgi:hypothetical protein|nr:hypothetical protein [Spirochaetaceae bacterium]